MPLQVPPGAPLGVSASSAGLVTFSPPLDDGGFPIGSYEAEAVPPGKALGDPGNPRVTVGPDGGQALAAQLARSLLAQAAGALQAQLTGLVGGTAYTAFVRAFNALGPGAWSAGAPFTFGLPQVRKVFEAS